MIDPQDEVNKLNDQIRQRAHADKIKEFRGQRLPYTDHGRREGSSSSASQHQHAEEVRDRRVEREARRRNPQGAKAFDAMMEFARQAQPSWHGKQSAAERHSYAHPHNVPKVVPPVAPPPEKERPRAKSGQEGGSITFVACVDNGDTTFTTKKISAVATSFAYP